MSRVLILWHEARFEANMRAAQHLTRLALRSNRTRLGRLDEAAQNRITAAMRHARAADRMTAA